jgi:phage shock protein A
VGVFKRISDIISANLNDMTEGFEDPEAMLRQAVREMEQTIAEVTEQTAKAMANETTLSRELERNRVQQRQWQDRAEKAIMDGNDELASKALGRKGEHEKLVVALSDQLGAAQEASESLRHQLAAMKAKLSEGKRNLATLSARKRAADFRKKMVTQVAGLTPEVDDSAFAKFDRMKAKVEQAEAEAAAMAELRGMDVGGPAASDADTSDEHLDVADELAELKRKLKK